MTRVVAALALSLALGSPAAADVVDAGATGFEVKVGADVNAAPDAVFRLITEVGRWWASSHTFSGNAANLSIEPRVGGCWCETLPNGGVQHMVVTYIDRPKGLILHGGLGPLASMGVAGALEFSLADKGGHTQLDVVYSVGGYRKGGFAGLATAVDGVITSQVKRLKALAETGRPE